MNRTQFDNPQNDEKLSRAIFMSIVAHLLLVAAFAVRVVFFPSEPINIESAIRVDMVDLPDKSPAKLPAPAPAEPAPEPQKAVEAPKPVEPPKPVEVAKPAPPKPVEVEAPKPKPKPVEVAKPDSPKVNLNKAKKDQDAALKRLEAMQKLEKMMKNEKSSKQAAANEASKSPTVATAPIKGNEISRGSSLTGVARLDHQNYVHTVINHVKQHWNLPRWLSDANLRAVVKVYVDSDGNVTKKQIVQSSQNEAFDDRVIAAIESATPFPAPPENLANRLSVYGMDLDLSSAD